MLTFRDTIQPLKSATFLLERVSGSITMSISPLPRMRTPSACLFLMHSFAFSSSFGRSPNDEEKANECIRSVSSSESCEVAGS